MRAARQAAQYVRTSTERQSGSIEFQMEANEAFAAARGAAIVRTYCDAGVSGLIGRARPALSRLLRDVLSGRAGFEAVLVHDVSRWGRFQDVDEGAHYEALCRSAGVEVIYTSEPFRSDGAPASTLYKQLKRIMAAEYSRSLSLRISSARRRIALGGYWLGGSCGFGFRRVARAAGGVVLAQMEANQRKAVCGARTLLEPGPPSEIAVVGRIYRLFVEDGFACGRIARLLNSEAVPAEGGGAWTRARVRQVLANEKYAGTLVSGRTRVILGRVSPQPEDAWLRVQGACAPLVSPRLFAAAQKKLRRAWRTPSDEVLLQDLRRILADKGRLSETLIRSDPEARSPTIYKQRFGGLLGAYARVGYTPEPSQICAMRVVRTHRPHLVRRRVASSDAELLGQLETVLAARGRLSVEILRAYPGAPSANLLRKRFGSLAEAYRRVGHVPTAVQAAAMASRRGNRSAPQPIGEGDDVGVR